MLMPAPMEDTERFALRRARQGRLTEKLSLGRGNLAGIRDDSVRTIVWSACALSIVGSVLVMSLPATVVRQEPGPRIAITVDDLPWNGPTPEEGRAAATERLLGSLTVRGVVATGFVRCAGIGPDAPLLRLWLERGMELGNHSESHRDLNSAPLDVWLEDVRTCDARLRDIVGGPVRYFRYPMLHQGPTPERREAALEVLRELNYEIAHVSVDNSEFMLSRPYEAAVSAGDTAQAGRIGRLLIEHIVRAVRHAQTVAERKLGRDVDHILLLHATLLVSDRMGALLDALAAEGFRFVSLDEALSDPVYQLPNGYTGRTGLSWLYRMEPATPEDANWDDAEAARIREALQQ